MTAEERKKEMEYYESELEKHKEEHPEGCTCKWFRWASDSIIDLLYDEMREAREKEGDTDG